MTSKNKNIDLQEFVDVLNLDEELQKLEEASFEKLRGVKNTIGNLHLHLIKLNTKKYLTKFQITKYNELFSHMERYYPVIDVTDNIKEINQRIRKKACEDYFIITNKNNRLFINKIYVDKVDEMLKKFQIYNHKEYMNEIIICECGMKSYRCNLTRHKKSNLHLNNLKKIEMKKNENNNNIEQNE
jgi:hypothetical protein